MSVKLDLKDRKLLYQLDINARQSYTKLAKKIGISKQLAKYKVERLEKLNLLKGYYTMIDTSKLGYVSIRVYVKFRNIDSTAKKKMLNYIMNQKAIFAVATISGKWDLVFLYNLKQIYNFYNYWDEILGEYLEFIKDYKICIYSPVYHFSKTYLIEQEDKSPIRILGGTHKISVDEVDLKLLRYLAENARISLVSLAEKLKLSPEAISHRIKQLEKKEIIQGYRAMIDVTKFGIEFYKADFRLRSMKEFKKLMTYCHIRPAIYQINRTIGGETLEIEFHVKNLKQLRNEIEQLEKEFPNIIEYYEYYNIFEELKVIYMPEI